MVIPNHSLFKLYRNKDTTKQLFSNANFILEEGLTLPISSDFGNLYTAPSNSLTDIMGMASMVSSEYKNSLAGKEVTPLQRTLRGFSTFGAGMSGKYKEFGFQVYKSSGPLELKLTLSLYATYNAYEQVYFPAMTLMKMPLPTTQAELNKYSDGRLLGLTASEQAVFSPPTGTSTEKAEVPKQTGTEEKTKSGVNLPKFSSLIAPGPSPSIIWSSSTGSESNDDWNNGRVFTCSIGNMFFDNVFVTAVNPTFSSEKMNVKGKYYPMSCKLQIDLRGVFTLTKAVIQEMIENNETI